MTDADRGLGTMAIRVDVFDQWWDSLAEVASDRIPAAEPSSIRPGDDPFGKRDGLAGRWGNRRDHAWDEW